MNEREFVAGRQERWDRLDAILHRMAGGRGARALTREEVLALGPLYRQAAADLARARSLGLTEPLVRHLNALVARGHAALYQTDARSWPGLAAFFARDLPATFRRRLPLFLAAVGFLLLGGLVGCALVASDRNNIDLFVPPGSEFRASLEVWERGNSAGRIPDSAAAAQSAFLMENNLRVSFTAFALGILGGVLTAWVLFFNGAMLGAFAGAMTHAGQHHTFWPGILPHGIVELSETCIAGAAGLSLGWAVLAPGLLTRRDALVVAARDSVKLILGGIAMLVFAGLVEAFLSHSLLPKPFKVAFGIASGLALYAWLLLAGREEGGVMEHGRDGTAPAHSVDPHLRQSGDRRVS